MKMITKTAMQCVSVFTISSLLILGSCGEKKAEQAAPPEVPYIKVKVKDVPLYQEFVGQTYGQADIDIQARVQGEVLKVHFLEGSHVKKGQLLYTIDPMEYDANVAQAQAQYAEAQSLMANADADLKRVRPLAEMNALSQRDLDAAIAREGAARGRLNAASAYLANQQLERSYCNITAPIDGVIGISKVKAGDLVGRSVAKSILTTLSSTGQMRVRFSVSENEFLKFREQLKNSDTPIDVNHMETEIMLADNSVYPHKGIINFSDRAIDPTTGTLTVESTFPNPEGVIRPGQFVRIRFITGQVKNAMLVPQRAVQELQGVYQVYVIKNDNMLGVKPIEPGVKIGSDWIVKNLDVNDRVALLGTQFIRPGSPVKPVPAATDSSTAK